MTKKSFIGGLFIAFITGFPLTFFNELIGAFVGIIIGSLFAASKKSGGAIGFFITPCLYLAPYSFPIFLDFVKGNIDLMYFLILIGFSLLDIMVLIITIIGTIVGILFGWLGLKFTKKK